MTHTIQHPRQFLPFKMLSFHGNEIPGTPDQIPDQIRSDHTSPGLINIWFEILSVELTIFIDIYVGSRTQKVIYETVFDKNE